MLHGHALMHMKPRIQEYQQTENRVYLKGPRLYEWAAQQATIAHQVAQCPGSIGSCLVLSVVQQRY